MNALPIDARLLGNLTPGTQLITDDGTPSGSAELKGVGSSGTPLVRYAGPAAGKVWYVTSVALAVIDTTTTPYDATSFAAVPGATSGGAVSVHVGTDDDLVQVVDCSNTLATRAAATVFGQEYAIAANDYMTGLFDMRALYGGHVPRLSGAAGERVVVKQSGDLSGINTGYTRVYYLEGDEV